MFIIDLFRCIFIQRISSSSIKKIRQAEVIIGQSFGIRDKEYPGKSNEVLADYARIYRHFYRLPLILQWEIAHFVPELIDSDCIIQKHRISGKYLDTFEVLFQAREICDRKFNGTRKAIIIAHPDHMWRVARTAEKLGFEPIIPEIAKIPYDLMSKQFWTKTRIMFLLGDRIARLIYLVSGKL